MNARTATTLVLAAGISVGACWLGSNHLRDSRDPGAASLAPDDSVAEESSSPTDLLIAPGDDHREGVPEHGETPPTRVDATSDQQAENLSPVPDDAVWIDCRLVVPGGMPPEEELIAVASGRAFQSGKLKGERNYRTRVEEVGLFRLAFAEGTTNGRLTLEGRFLSLSPALFIDFAEAKRSVPVIEPTVGGVIRGRVLLPKTASPEEASRVKVKVIVSSQAWSRRISSSKNGEPLDSEGRFERGLLPPGLYNVEAGSRPFQVAKVNGVQVVAGEVTEIELELRLGVRLRGTVSGTQGTGATIKVHSTTPEGWSGWLTHPINPTGEEEVCSFDYRGVTPGEITLEASRPGALTTKLELGTQVDGAVLEGLHLELDEGLAIEGVVRWLDGSPAEEASVRAVDPSREKPTQPFARPGVATRTDAEGRFRLSGLSDGWFLVQTTADPREPHERGGRRWSAERAEVRAGTRGLLLVLEPGESLVGRVIDDTGAPVDSFQLEVVSETKKRFEADDLGDFGLPETESFLDPDGRFVLEGLGAGAWRIRALSAGHASSPVQSIRSPYRGPELEFVVPRHGTIRGVVLDPSGAAMPRARVKARLDKLARTAARFDSLAHTLTDQRGAFELSGVIPGELQLVASATGFGGSAPFRVQLAPAERIEELILQLRESAGIVGRIDPAAGSVDGRVVSFGLLGGGRDQRIMSDRSGEFQAEDLTPGSYTMFLLPNGETQAKARLLGEPTPKFELQFELLEGETKQIVLGAPGQEPLDSGRTCSVWGLVLAPDGSPAADARVTIMRFGKSTTVQLASPARTDSEGRFEHHELGVRRLLIHASRGELASEPQEVRVIEGKSIEVVLQLKE